MNFSLLHFFKLASGMPQITQIFSLDFQHFPGGMPLDPQQEISNFFFISNSRFCLNINTWFSSTLHSPCTDFRQTFKSYLPRHGTKGWLYKFTNCTLVLLLPVVGEKKTQRGWMRTLHKHYFSLLATNQRNLLNSPSIRKKWSTLSLSLTHSLFPLGTHTHMCAHTHTHTHANTHILPPSLKPRSPLWVT